MVSLFSALFLVCFVQVLQRTTRAHRWEPTKTIGEQHLIPAGSATAKMGGQPPNCFPAIGFKMPGSIEDIERASRNSNWWCDYNTEYAFMGFSYEVTACK